MNYADWLRWDIIVEGFVLIGFAVAVLSEAKKFRAPPSHVYWITASYSVFIAAFILEIYGRIGTAFSWRVVAGQFSMKFGLIAMLVMYHHYNRSQRILRHNAKSDKIAGDLLRSEEAHVDA